MPLNEDRDRRQDARLRRELGEARRLKEAATKRMEEANMILHEATKRYRDHFGGDDD